MNQKEIVESRDGSPDHFQCNRNRSITLYEYDKRRTYTETIRDRMG